MTGRRRRLPSRTARIGLFGLFGIGNTGNDGSLDAVLQRLRVSHDDSEFVCICREPDRVQREVGVAAVSMLSYRDKPGRARALSLSMRVLSKFIDPFWLFLVVRRLDVVVVPGMGVFEQQIRVRPWGLPYAMFLMSGACRLSGTKLAFVSVGAEPIDHPVTRYFNLRTAGRADFCSYRDEFSQRAMIEMGASPDACSVCPDVVFGLPAKPGCVPDTGVICVGVMAYYGPTDDKARGAATHQRYVEKVTGFVGWLVDEGYPVHLMSGDVADERVAEVIKAHVLGERPTLGDDAVVVVSTDTLGEVIDSMRGARAVVATRYHNALCALHLNIPTIALGYGGKHDDLMAVMGLAEYSAHVASFEPDWLVSRLSELIVRAPEIVADLAVRNQVAAGAVAEQHERLERTLFRTVGNGE
jgi:polysaccharide pyruvyl transferase WcaK-like protein